MADLPRPEALLFDVGGTLLVERAYDLAAGVRAVLADASLPTTSDPAAAGSLAGALAAAIDRAHAEADEEFRVRDWLRELLREGAGVEAAEQVLWHAAGDLAPAPGVEDLLDELAAEQLPLAAVSNAVFDGRVLASELERHGLRRPFTCVVSSADVGRRKPHPAPFAAALRRLGVAAERAWFVGDRFATDVVGAAGAGLTAVWLASAGEAPGPTPHLRIRQLSELLPLYRASRPA